METPAAIAGGQAANRGGRTGGTTRYTTRIARTASAYGNARSAIEPTTPTTPDGGSDPRRKDEATADTTIAATTTAATTRMNTVRRIVFATIPRDLTPMNIAWTPSSTDE